ncbi:hypothetical protein A2Z41_03280 [Microgenomates group bacterium RBG_19FT_COMBO_39_10]|nr:MAG: hypothetical protein A2Z41_03280 [Microgenomates group bacterium RBG_19FT_COMBO_39_10]
MAKIDRNKRRSQIKIKQRRKKKLAKWRQLYSKAGSQEKKEEILAKVRRSVPLLSKEEFLASIKE